MNFRTLAAASLTALGLLGASHTASAHETTYNVTTTFLEPDTQPYDSVFTGTFDYDEHTGTVSNLQGSLTESMTGSRPGGLVSLSLTHQLKTWHDDTLAGTFAATFLNDSTNTFWTGPTGTGDGWSPGTGLALYSGFPGANPGNAYVLIFVPDVPTTPLTPAQIDKLAYADCAPGGMMMTTCMTGTAVAGYGVAGSMGGYPLSQTIAAVPEPSTVILSALGLGMIGGLVRRRRAA
ncbi:MAG: PEP-CTERM sorting domain-containing protein [Burkholderiales bacterium]